VTQGSEGDAVREVGKPGMRPIEGRGCTRDDKGGMRRGRLVRDLPWGARNKYGAKGRVERVPANQEEGRRFRPGEGEEDLQGKNWSECNLENGNEEQCHQGAGGYFNSLFPREGLGLEGPLQGVGASNSFRDYFP